MSVTCTGVLEPGGLKPATSKVEEFSIVLCDLKTLLESGRSAHPVRDKAELIAHALAVVGRASFSI